MATSKSITKIYPTSDTQPICSAKKLISHQMLQPYVAQIKIPIILHKSPNKHESNTTVRNHYQPLKAMFAHKY